MDTTMPLKRQGILYQFKAQKEVCNEHDSKKMACHCFKRVSFDLLSKA